MPPATCCATQSERPNSLPSCAPSLLALRRAVAPSLGSGRRRRLNASQSRLQRFLVWSNEVFETVPPSPVSASSALFAVTLRTNKAAIPGWMAAAITSERYLPARRQLVEAAQDERLPPIRMLDVINAQTRQAAEQRVDCNLAFEAGKLRPNAVMDAAAK